MTRLPTEQSSYQSELVGVLGVLTCVEVFVMFYKIRNDLIAIALDEESAMYQSDSEWPLSIDQSSFNYIQLIRISSRIFLSLSSSIGWKGIKKKRVSL